MSLHLQAALQVVRLPRVVARSRQVVPARVQVAVRRAAHHHHQVARPPQYRQAVVPRVLAVLPAVSLHHLPALVPAQVQAIAVVAVRLSTLWQERDQQFVMVYIPIMALTTAALPMNYQAAEYGSGGILQTTGYCP